MDLGLGFKIGYYDINQEFSYPTKYTSNEKVCSEVFFLALVGVGGVYVTMG